jgi:hypothetical protein
MTVEKYDWGAVACLHAELSRAECRVCLEDKRCLVCLLFVRISCFSLSFEFAVGSWLPDKTESDSCVRRFTGTLSRARKGKEHGEMRGGGVGAKLGEEERIAGENGMIRTKEIFPPTNLTPRLPKG